MKIKIYVQLLNEGTEVYRPVPAIKIKDNIYQLRGDDIYDSKDEEWEFVPNEIVIVKSKYIGNELVLLATQKK